MIDIARQKSLFPLKNFEDVERLFGFNIDRNNGEPNLALLSIVAGLIEHSLVSITDREDLLTNSRPVNDRKATAQRKFALNRLVNSPSQQFTSQNQSAYNLTSTSSSEQHSGDIAKAGNSDIKADAHRKARGAHKSASESISYETNEVGYVVSCSGDSSEQSSACSSPDYTSNDNLTIPEIEFEVVETLYKQFVDQIKGSIDSKGTEALKTNLKIKQISDSVWKHLTNSYYKDKTHLQSIFSYLTTSKLDCFGLAFAVLAACQILNLKNIYLALSEDHAWVMFDLSPEEIKSSLKEKEIHDYTSNNLPVPTCVLHGTCEVTWHGKANSDKRGQCVTYKNCWLYTNGYAVKCDTFKCVAALVNSINPSINSNTDSEILALLQQRLMWMLYQRENYFPMSLGNLGELEDLCPTPDAPMTPHDLFNLGIEISRNEYNDSHVYPYTYLASFFFNHGRFKEALETWADSSNVMTKYNYSRDDEEIYKEFFEVANELIPSMLKVLTAGGLEPGKVSLKPFLQDPECLALILKFYDNICCWEEGSSTPVLHIGWAKNFVATVLKFSSIVRSKIKLSTEDEWLHSKANASECEVASSRTDQCSSTFSDNQLDRRDISPSGSNSIGGGGGTSGGSALLKSKHTLNIKQEARDADTKTGTSGTHNVDSQQTVDETSSTTTISPSNGGEDGTSSEKCNASLRAKRNRTDSLDYNYQQVAGPYPKQQRLDGAAGGGGAGSSGSAGGIAIIQSTGNNDTAQFKGKNYVVFKERRLEFDNDNNVTVILRSRKIAGVRDLLQAERLNKTAIELQLTAQSQCAVRGRSNSNSTYSSDFISSALVSITGGSTTRSKRLHR